MKPIKVLYIILAILVFATIVSLIKCRSTGHLTKERNPIDEQNFRDSMDQMSRHALWANANDKIEDEKGTTADDLKYYRDPRVDLCFVVFKNRDIEKVPCGHLRDVL